MHDLATFLLGYGILTQKDLDEAHDAKAVYGGRFLDTLGRSEAQEVLVQPVTLRGRVVSLLYADNASAPFAETSAAALAAISPILSRAYENLIVRMRG